MQALRGVTIDAFALRWFQKYWDLLSLQLGVICLAASLREVSRERESSHRVCRYPRHQTWYDPSF